MRPLMFSTALAMTATALCAAPALARDRDDTFRITANQVVDMADARIAQLKADLRLTPDQDKNWGPLQSAMHDMAVRRADRMTKLREQRTAADPAAQPPAAQPPADRDARVRDDRDYRDRDSRADRDAPLDLAAELRRRADDMTARAEDYRKFADAAGPLYGSLDDGQRRRFLAFVARNMFDEGEVRSRR